MLQPLSANTQLVVERLNNRINGTPPYNFVLLATRTAFLLGKRYPTLEEPELLPQELLCEIIDSYVSDIQTILDLFPDDSRPADLDSIYHKLYRRVNGTAIEAPFQYIAMQAKDGILLAKHYNNAPLENTQMLQPNYLGEIIDNYCQDLRPFLAQLLPPPAQSIAVPGLATALTALANCYANPNPDSLATLQNMYRAALLPTDTIELVLNRQEIAAEVHDADSLALHSAIAGAISHDSNLSPTFDLQPNPGLATALHLIATYLMAPSSNTLESIHQTMLVGHIPGDITDLIFQRYDADLQEADDTPEAPATLTTYRALITALGSEDN